MGLRQHHMSLYNRYRSMLTRCFNESDTNYPRYGAKGIRVCGRWRGKGGFERFFEDIGPVPPGKQLDRKNSTGHYSCGKCDECLKNGWPSNVRWATTKQQQRNRSDTRIVTFRGKRQCLTDHAADAGINYQTVLRRINIGGWPLKEALTTPPYGRCGLVTYRGKSKTVASWARIAGIPYFTFVARLKAGWSMQDAMTRPLRRKQSS